MSLHIHNAATLMAVDLNVLGAAVKIALAGGSALSEQQMRRASGASWHLWNAKGDAICHLVRILEAQSERAQDQQTVEAM